MGALMRLGQMAQRLGHRLDVLFRPDLYKIPQYHALLIRTLTDPMNSTYVASRLAQLHGLRVIDDPESIMICCDKVHMYRCLLSRGVSVPETVFLSEADLTLQKGADLLDEMGRPLVLQAPNSSFSLYVERVSLSRDFVHVGKRFLRRADRVVAQQYVASEFDWRVGVLNGEVLYVCQYLIPKRRWKILTYTEAGRVITGRVRRYDMAKVDPKLLQTALQAAAAIGNGLYGMDIKQVGDSYFVIELNDNPTIAEAEEDQKAPRLYERLIRYLVGERG
jgi:glutathione synthase/RimK-type ligase-like ATP-grasp enzyme